MKHIKLFNESFRLNEAASPKIPFIKTWMTKVMNPGEDYNQYDDKAPKDWDGDSFKSWIEGKMNLDGEISDATALKVSGLPAKTDIIELLNKNGSGLNGDKFYKKFDNWRGALYDIWEHILSKTK